MVILPDELPIGELFRVEVSERHLDVPHDRRDFNFLLWLEGPVSTRKHLGVKLNILHDVTFSFSLVNKLCDEVL